MRVTALAGGVGGAKLSNGFANILSSEDFSVIVNTGDDFEFSGLYICPDLDTVTYTLAGINDPFKGWGLKDDTWNVLAALERIGHPTWFNLGDRDLATHLERTRLLQLGKTLTEATEVISKTFGVKHSILPMSDTRIQTMIETVEFGVITFQEYFVKYHFQPKMRSITFSGNHKAVISEPIVDVLQFSDLVVICPSNPFVSIEPILSIPGMRELIFSKPVIAVSPLIGGKTVKGPAAKIMSEMGIKPSAAAIAEYYGSGLTGFILDRIDQAESESIRQCGIIPLETDILIPDVTDQTRLAKEVLDFAKNIL